MLKNVIKYLMCSLLASMFLLGIQSSSAEAAEYTEQERLAMNSEEWKKYVESPEEYSFSDVQTLSNGVVVIYNQDNDLDNGIMPLTETISKNTILDFMYNNIHMMTFLEESKWAYGGAVGNVPYLGSVTYQARYLNYSTGITGWSTPSMQNLRTQVGKAVYNVAVELSFSYGTGTYYCYDVTQTF